MKLSDVVYSITYGDLMTQHIQRNPEFIKRFMEGGIPGSMDFVTAPTSINIKRADLQELVALLRVMGEL